MRLAASSGLAAALFAAAAGCSLSGFFDELPLDFCTPEARYPVECGLCAAGDGLALCLPDRTLEVQSCDDPDDADGDGWPNDRCIGLRPDCAACEGLSDCADGVAAVNPGAAEACNGIDDDCDGETDETFACAVGASISCTTACGSTGTGTCTAECEVSGPDACTPSEEACNATDDDCDDDTDEDFDCVLGSAVTCATRCGWSNVGTCTVQCEVPGPDDCPLLEEACGNGVDDDCDTATDEGC
jgi:hypothetical protein